MSSYIFGDVLKPDDLGRRIIEEITQWKKNNGDIPISEEQLHDAVLGIGTGPDEIQFKEKLKRMTDDKKIGLCHGPNLRTRHYKLK